MRIDGSMNVINFGARKIPYKLYREERKRMRIVVAPELTVAVFAPATADEEQIRAAVMKKAAWIAGKLDALERYHPLPAPKKYISGETFVYLGRQYRLKVEQGCSQPAKLMGRFLRVCISPRKFNKAEESVLPGLSSMIAVMDAATPLTNVRYTGNPQGAIYGFEQTVGNTYMYQIGNVTPFPGLYVSSAWSSGGEYMPTVASGLSTATRLLKDFGHKKS
jgi:hypothetical protein